MKSNNRREFLKKSALASAAAITLPSWLSSCNSKGEETPTDEIRSRLIVPKNNALKITGTFLDEISHDIPHQNWGEKEWDADFRHMKAIGIDTVIMIRSGYRKFITYPSEYLIGQGCYKPSVDLLDMYLRLADKYGMKFYFGLYDSGKYWDTNDLTWEIEHNKHVIDEVWKNYGEKYKSFQGWYISTEISRKDQRGNRNISCIRKTMQRYIEWITYIHISMDRWEKSRAGIKLDTDQERIMFR